MADDPFYDGAVRTMGGSWHAFLTGAIDPAATVAVDKPPGYLWLQVVATKVVGFGSVGLHLPAAIAGFVAVVALYDALRTLFGRAARLAGGIALAVLPVAVITARSDTMDSVVAALDVVALALVARAIRSRRPWPLLLAGLALGLTFEVKPFEGLVARRARTHGVARAAARQAGHRGGRRGPRRRGARVARRAAAARRRAPPVGLRLDGRSAWNAAFVYDGVGRLGEHARPAASAASLARIPAAAGPLRLFEARDGLGLRVGLELAAAILVACALVVRACRASAPPARAGGDCSRGWRRASCSPRRRAACDRATSRAWTPRSPRSSEPARCSPRAAGSSPPSARCSWARSSSPWRRSPTASRTPGRRGRWRPRASRC